MKKQLLIAALGIMSVGASAQTFEEQDPLPNSGPYLVPKCYVKADKPCILFHNLWDDGYTKESTVYVYDENLSLVKNFSVNGSILDLFVIDYDNCSSDEFHLSQTLFNDDDSFEYLQPLEYEDGEFSGMAYAIKVMSDMGTELGHVTFKKPLFLGFVNLIHIADKDYLLIDRYESEDSEVYLINKSNNGENAIQEVKAPELLKAIPSLARRNQSVNIELDENACSSLQVTAANGSVVRRLPIRQGQKTVQLSTRGLSSGLYVVSTVGANGTQENCKIVVK